MRHTAMTRGDKFLLAGLLLMALLSLALLYGRLPLFHSGSASVQAVITVRGNIIRKVQLPSAGRSSFVVQGRVGPSTVELDGARIRIQEAPCPGQVCVSQGWISHPGQSVICIPGEILIRIEGAAPLDAVTR